MTIKEICKTYDLTQTALAAKFGIPLRTVQDWWAGRRTPPPYVVTLIQNALEKQKEDD